jgi:hypothetical protein
MGLILPWLRPLVCPPVGYGHFMPEDLPPELRGVSPDPVHEPRTPAWVRVVALVLIVALVGYFVISAF